MADVERKMVRFMATDVAGTLKTERAMRKVKGISFMFSRAICIYTGIDRNARIGSLSEEQIKKLEGAVKSPQLPVWLLNRRKDPETGENNHISMAQLKLKKMEDINLLRRIRAYKGVRHELGLPVRGQRTRGSFRVNKSVGVSKRKLIAAAAPKKASQPTSEKPAAAPAKK